VAPEHRRAGVAQALLDETIHRLRRSGVKEFELMVRTDSKPAISFYRRNGFTKVRTVHNYYGQGAPGIQMGRAL
jgi:ribosomal-protein-alanine N-acetyltransferase